LNNNINEITLDFIKDLSLKYNFLCDWEMDSPNEYVYISTPIIQVNDESPYLYDSFITYYRGFLFINEEYSAKYSGILLPEIKVEYFDKDTIENRIHFIDKSFQKLIDFKIEKEKQLEAYFLIKKENDTFQDRIDFLNNYGKK
jgi:hypothetical protein